MPPDPISQSVQGVTQLVKSSLNKVGGGAGDEPEGISREREDILALDLSDEELLKLASNATARYEQYGARIEVRQKKNRAYYLGMQFQGQAAVQDDPVASNLIFEAEETFLPAALAKPPEPVVFSDNTTEGTAESQTIKTMIQYHAKTLVLRRKLARMTRQWSIDLLGVMKHGWNPEMNDISTETRDVKNFVFDPDGYIDEYGDYIGPLLGERMPTTADKLAELFPDQKAYIAVMVDGLMGTKVTYTEWWSNQYCFYTFKNRVLDKNKNPNFNYDREEEEEDEYGEKTMAAIPGRNHFATPKMPYTFLSVFSLGEHPHDETGLIEQNIGNQNRITKRDIQIDLNLERSNNSIGLSAQNFNEETAKQAAVAMQKGNPVLIPAGGPISEAVARFPAPGLPDAIFRAQDTAKNDLRQIFGTQGITAQQPDEDQTARGMILNQQYDTTRIGGGIGDALEQVAENIFNWWLQLYYVFYDEEHYAAVLGQMKAVEFVTMSNQNILRKHVVTVAPNSMKPKDEITEMNQAMALYDKGILDPKTLFTLIDFPDPQKSAEQAVLWKLDPAAYMQLNFPELAAKLQAFQAQKVQEAAAAMAQGAGGMPAESVTEPAQGIEAEPANAALANVPLEAGT